jgi:hypothetical protein
LSEGQVRGVAPSHPTSQRPEAVEAIEPIHTNTHAHQQHTWRAAPLTNLFHPADSIPRLIYTRRHTQRWACAHGAGAGAESAGASAGALAAACDAAAAFTAARRRRSLELSCICTQVYQRGRHRGTEKAEQPRLTTSLSSNKPTSRDSSLLITKTSQTGKLVLVKWLTMALRPCGRATARTLDAVAMGLACTGCPPSLDCSA